MRLIELGLWKVFPSSRELNPLVFRGNFLGKEIVSSGLEMEFCGKRLFPIYREGRGAFPGGCWFPKVALVPWGRKKEIL